MLDRSVDRRAFLGIGGLGAASLLLGSKAPLARADRHTFAGDPFSLGVASGDPLSDSVVLWTRLAPDPLNGGGMPSKTLEVRYEVARDEGFRKIVDRGETKARPELAHSVHVEVDDLDSSRWYWYRFKVGSEESPVGRTRTAPSWREHVKELRFAFASCQNYTQGLYPAYRHMAEEDLDVVVHLGDYIYESGAQTPVRPHLPAFEIRTLDDYRTRHAQYRLDANLQAAHAAFPWILTWDDHEVENNYADENSTENVPPEQFLARRSAAYQAYYEHLPLRKSSVPRGPDLQLYRRVHFGDFAQFHVLDTRQHRDLQTNCAGEELVGGYCATAVDPSRTILGDKQERWLLEGLDRSDARWNVLAQQIILSQRDNNAAPEIQAYVGDGDQWDGYKADRDTILDFLRRRRPRNPVVITGDVHNNFAYDVKADFSDPASKTVATEFVGTSICSGGNPAAFRTEYDSNPNDPHQRFFDNHRGYVRCSLTPKRWLSEYRGVASVTDEAAAISTVASFVVEDGRPGAQRL
jgi:alkaline phosphatase D